jgi:hypothetical protein
MVHCSKVMEMKKKVEIKIVWKNEFDEKILNDVVDELIKKTRDNVVEEYQLKVR